MERVEEIVIIRRTVPVIAQPSTGALVNAVLGKMRTAEKGGRHVPHVARTHLQQMDAANVHRGEHDNAVQLRTEWPRGKHAPRFANPRTKHIYPRAVLRIAHFPHVHAPKRSYAARLRFHHSAIPASAAAFPFAVRPTVPLIPPAALANARMQESAAHRALRRDAAKLKRHTGHLAEAVPHRVALPAAAAQPRGHVACAGRRVHGHGHRPYALVAR